MRRAFVKGVAWVWLSFSGPLLVWASVSLHGRSTSPPPDDGYAFRVVMDVPWIVIGLIVAIGCGKCKMSSLMYVILLAICALVFIDYLVPV